MIDFEALYQIAVGYLAKREYLRQELYIKLMQFANADSDLTNAVLDALISRGYLSESRAISMYIQSRIEKGFGTERIEQELQAKGVEQSLSEVFSNYDWQVLLESVWKKRFKGEWPHDDMTQAKQAHFLSYRGFTQDQIECFFQRNR